MSTDSFKCISFNVNGLRARLHQLQAVIDRHQPLVIGLQETKVHDDEFPLEAVQAMGYHVTYHGQKGHYGVALLSKQAPEKTSKGFPGDEPDAQRRLVSATLELGNGSQLTVINGYFPQGESRDHPAKFPAKRAFYANLLKLLNDSHKPTDQLLVMGDMNISPSDLDIGIGDDNRKRWLRSGKCSFLPEEREWYQSLYDWGLGDCYRKHSPDSQQYFSWFDYRSRGFERAPKRGLRIDHLLATDNLIERCTAAGIDYEVRAMEKPSDHAPAWAEFAL
ncbi:MAG: exodeoxyribonuclease III [Porticoccaceae bacterium]|nr:exodeoxyribonuclease III [Porticoccaceae bacterium]